MSRRRAVRVIANVKYGVFEIAADGTVYLREEDGRLVREKDERVADEVYQAALAAQVVKGKRIRLPRT